VRQLKHEIAEAGGGSPKGDLFYVIDAQPCVLDILDGDQLTVFFDPPIKVPVLEAGVKLVITLSKQFEPIPIPV
jgi:hypothetical protein